MCQWYSQTTPSVPWQAYQVHACNLESQFDAIWSSANEAAGMLVSNVTLT